MVMSVVWIGMLVFSILAAIFQGNLGNLTPAAMEGAKSAVTLCLSLAGALCLWSGFAKVMEQGGLTAKLGKLLRPILGRLFPKACEDAETLGYLTANISANFLGLGNAATPMGVAAVKRMGERKGARVASDEQCLLIVLNSASIQLLPTTVASIRAALGGASPFDILPAVWLTSIASVVAGILAARLLRRFC